MAVTSLSEPWTVFAHSNSGIVGSNPIPGMDVCMYVYAAYVEALRWADLPSKES
jgi:hypothetical protein